MAKYSKGAKKGVESAMKRMEKGTLRSGGSGKKVTNPKQAIAIGLSEAKKKGAKVPPPPKKKAAAKKTATKKAASKKPAERSSPRAKKAAPKKAAVKKSAAKKPLIKKKAAAKKAPVKKAAAKKPVAKKAPQKKAAVKKPVERSSLRAKKTSSKPVKPEVLPKKEDLPPKSELSEEMHEEAVHEEKETQSMMGTAHGAEIMEKKEDPIMAFDMHMAQKATSKGDRSNKLRLSSTGQRPMRPSGKKPLWRK